MLYAVSDSVSREEDYVRVVGKKSATNSGGDNNSSSMGGRKTERAK